MTAAPPDEIDPDISRLIEITYSSTADPAQFEGLLAVWKSYMDRTHDLDRNAPHLPHFNRALEIFNAMGRRRREQSREQDIVGAFSAHAFLCRRDLHVQAANAAGQALLATRGAGLDAVPDLSAALRRLNSLRRTDIVPLSDDCGRPMLFLHNMMGGTSLPPHILRLARRGGWRIIAPSRPGFGASDSVGLTGQRLVDRTAQDMRELLDHLGLEAALVLGLMSSAGLAVTFAHMYPTRTAAVLNIAHADVCDDEMIEAMATPSRTMAATWRKSQTALRFLVRVAVASVDMMGPQKTVRRMLSLNPADARLTEDQAIVNCLSAMLAHATVQGGEAFSKDGYVSLRDFSDTIRALHPNIPVLSLLGADDRIYRPDHALRLVPKVQHYPVEVLPDAGQYLFYGHTETVFARADDLWARAAHRVGTTVTPRIGDDHQI